MPKTKISEFSATPANNTDIDSINISEGCAPSGINDAIRELMAQLKDWQSGTSNDPYVIGSSGSLTLNQGTANGVTYLNGSKVVTTGSALTFDGTNLGVNTTSPVGKVESKTATVASGSADFAQKAFVANIPFSASNIIGSMLSGWDGSTIHAVDVGYTYNGTGYVMMFSTNDNTSGSPIERARIDSSGNLLVGTTSGTQPLRVVGSRSGDYVGYFANSNGSSPFGIDIVYTSLSPNNTSNRFIDCEDTTTARFTVRSNGGIANYSGNNVNLSDRREKTNFAPAKSYLETICAIPVQTFNYIDQNLEEDGGLTLGVVAQDVQAVAPELVMESNWGNKDEPKMRLSIYQTDLQYALMKCIQEMKTIIDDQAARIATLEAK